MNRIKSQISWAQIIFGRGLKSSLVIKYNRQTASNRDLNQISICICLSMLWGWAVVTRMARSGTRGTWLCTAPIAGSSRIPRLFLALFSGRSPELHHSGGFSVRSWPRLYNPPTTPARKTGQCSATPCPTSSTTWHLVVLHLGDQGLYCHVWN